MCAIAAIYLTLPALLVSMFEGDRDPEDFAAVAALVPGLHLQRLPGTSECADRVRGSLAGIDW